MKPEATTTSEEQPETATDPAAGPAPSVSWEASEFVQHDKPLWWYLAVVAAAVVLVVVFVLLHQWPAVAVVAVMAVAVVVYSRKPPRTLQYLLDEKGITIQSKLLPYSHFRSYSLHEAVSWQEIELEPAKRFSPRLTLLVSKENFDAIEQTLKLHLPRVQRDHDAIELFTRYIKF